MILLTSLKDKFFQQIFSLKKISYFDYILIKEFKNKSMDAAQIYLEYLRKKQ